MSLEIANGLAKTGLKSTTKLHTNTFLDGKVEMAKFKLAKATINMPKDKMEILEVSADFSTLTSDGQYMALQTKNPSIKRAHCTPELFRYVNSKVFLNLILELLLFWIYCKYKE